MGVERPLINYDEHGMNAEYLLRKRNLTTYTLKTKEEHTFIERQCKDLYEDYRVLCFIHISSAG